ncbi:phage holin family protein [Nocardioides dongxiaopingii]|uniref:phage holin family protein n=1 Tax=Nocardioides TaxID=1839 RepID=UPI0010C769CA|nr:MULTISPECIES: phage holin family protein [Nocardioides]QCW49485.1 phage holin family protein [Nocardioides sp. S-1144]
MGPEKSAVDRPTDRTVGRVTDAGEEPTIGKLVTDASRDISTLISKEIQLAKSELKVSIKFGVAGVAFFAVAGFLLLLAVIMLSVAFAYLIHWNGSGLSLHWAFLIVTLAYVLIAALFGFLGIKKVKKVGPPEKAIGQGKQIPNALKGKS